MGKGKVQQAFRETFTVPATSGLVLLVALFADRRRCLHDMLSGVIVVNTAGDVDPAR